jgi:hypothetical protein
MVLSFVVAAALAGPAAPAGDFRRRTQAASCAPISCGWSSCTKWRPGPMDTISRLGRCSRAHATTGAVTRMPGSAVNRSLGSVERVSASR